MTDNIFMFDFNGVKVARDSNTKLIRLSVTSVSGVATTFKNSEDNSSYQVPASKKATIIYIEDSAALAGASDEIFYADDEDGETNKVTLLKPSAALLNVIFISEEIPAGKYVNIKENSVDTAEIYLVEELA